MDIFFRMFKYLTFYLLLIFLLSVKPFDVWVKPSVNRCYSVLFKCVKWTEINFDGFLDQLVTIGTSVREMHDECKIMDIEQHLSKCNVYETTAYIEVQDLCSRKTKYFEIMLTDLIKRQLPIVIGFDIAASSFKTFYIHNNGEQMDFEFEINCISNHLNVYGMKKYFVFASGIQKADQPSVTIRIYDLESMSMCRDGQAVFEIEYTKNESCFQTFPSISKNVLIGADAFNINVFNRSINSISKKFVNNVQTNTSMWPAETSISIRPSVSVLNSPSMPMNDVKLSQQEAANKSSQCLFCEDAQREIAFIPCGHYCACVKCSKKLKTKCPLCNANIETTLRIFP